MLEVSNVGVTKGLYSRGFQLNGKTVLSVDFQDGCITVSRYDTLEKFVVSPGMSLREFFELTRSIRPELVNAALDAIGEFILTGELE